jgi:hypothetical protein
VGSTYRSTWLAENRVLKAQFLPCFHLPVQTALPKSANALGRKLLQQVVCIANPRRLSLLVSPVGPPAAGRHGDRASDDGAGAGEAQEMETGLARFTACVCRTGGAITSTWANRNVNEQKNLENKNEI